MSDLDFRFPSADLSEETGDIVMNQTGRLSIFNMYRVLASYMSAYEKGLSESIRKIEGSNASDIDQGALLQLQAMVQTWGTVAGISTGIVRTVGDTLTKIVQNIR
jgi:hypothetical protein